MANVLDWQLALPDNIQTTLILARTVLLIAPNVRVFTVYVKSAKLT